MPSLKLRASRLAWGLAVVCNVLVFLAVTSPAGFAGEVTAMSFGAIALYPGASSVVIAAEKGPATPLGIQSVVTDGNSGLLTLNATSGEEELVAIGYPESLLLSCGSHHVTVTEIPARSQYNSTDVVLPGSGVAVTVSIGGVLQLLGNEAPCNYSGTMYLQLLYH